VIGVAVATFGSGEVDRGRLELEVSEPGKIAVYFVFADQFASELRAEGDDPPERIRIVNFDTEDRRVSMYPIRTMPLTGNLGRPKYDQLRCVSVPWTGAYPIESEDDVLGFLDGLPRGLTKDPQYGLGFPREYAPIVDALEDLTDCTELLLTDGAPEGLVGNSLVVSHSDFQEIRRHMDRITGRAQIASLYVRKAHAINWVGGLVGKEEVAYKRGRHPMIQRFADAAAGGEVFEPEDFDDLLALVDEQAGAIAQSRPQALAKLKSDIELVELDSLIERFRRMLHDGHGEPAWQDFLRENPFLLSFALSYPLMLVQDQASIGGRKLEGGGEKITDFLAKNPSTNNAALFEIKKPGTPLLHSTPYRSGVFRASSELSGSIAQVLDQRYQFTKSIALIRDSSRDFDIESFAVKACLIVGTTPENLDNTKSFELLRNAVADVEILTFDELLAKAETLRSFLGGNQGEE